MPTIDFPTIDLSKIKLPFELPFDLPKIDLPTVEVPAFDLSKMELPKLDLSKLDLSRLNLDEVPSPEQVIEWFRDAVFAGTGLVALTAERVAELQKQFVELVKTQVKRVQG